MCCSSAFENASPFRLTETEQSVNCDGLVRPGHISMLLGERRADEITVCGMMPFKMTTPSPQISVPICCAQSHGLASDSPFSGPAAMVQRISVETAPLETLATEHFVYFPVSGA